jgi:aflatoxin B1 aldehyde reductase
MFQKSYTMSPSTPVKLVLGCGDLGAGKLTGDAVAQFFNIFHDHRHTEIDTAAAYPIQKPGESEGAVSGVGDWAIISTKILKPFTTEKVKQDIEAGLERLGGRDVDILYLHVPDTETPLDETLAAIDVAFRAGKFKRFGVSNYSPEMLESIFGICDKQGEISLVPSFKQLLIRIRLCQTFSLSK